MPHEPPGILLTQQDLAELNQPAVSKVEQRAMNYVSKPAAYIEVDVGSWRLSPMPNGDFVALPASLAWGRPRTSREDSPSILDEDASMESSADIMTLVQPPGERRYLQGNVAPRVRTI